MNFTQFINEEIALGNLSGQMERLFGARGFNQVAGSYVSSDVNGSEAQEISPGHSLHLPSTDMQVPNIERQGRITTLLAKRNPIFVRLSDGTEAFFTYDEFKRIKGQPALGKTMLISFQRHRNDNSRNNSQIVRAIVID